MRSRGSIIIISAPSGAGKSSVVQRLLPRTRNLVFSVSHTTRDRREGEEDGREYFFITRNVFQKMIDEGEFFEWAEYAGNLYGTSRTFVESQCQAGNDVLLDIEINGARKVKQLVPDAVSIFLMPPSYQALAERLEKRNLDSGETIRRRLKIAAGEIKVWREYDYIVINDEIDDAVTAIHHIVEGARCRRENVRCLAEEIADTFGEKTHETSH